MLNCAVMFESVLGVVTVVSSSVGIWAAVNTTYRCLSSVLFQVGGATVTFSDMRLEAYMPGNDLSPRGPALSFFFVLFFFFRHIFCELWEFLNLFPLIIAFYVISCHRKFLCSRSDHHCSSDHHCCYDNAPPGPDSSRNPRTGHLLRG